MSRLTALVCALVLLACAGHAHAWQANGLEWPSDLVPISIELHGEGIEELSVEELEAEVLISLEEWNRVGCARPVLEYGGQTELREAIDEHQVYRWIESEEEWGNQGTMVAGATRINVTSLPGRPSVDIVYNAVNFTWQPGGGGWRRPDILDPRSVITHETGHLLGLTHTNDDSAATMAASYLPDLGQATLSRDDKIGICELFWGGGDDCDTDEDCREGERCEPYTSEANGATVMICGEIRGTFGDPCSAEDLNCEAMCLFTAQDFSEGYCSDRCETDDDCPGGFFCHNFGTPSNPFLACRIDPNAGADEDGEDVAGEDAGVDAGSDSGDMGRRDTVEGGDMGDSADVAPPPPPPDSKADDCSCATARPAGGWWGLGLVLLLLGLIARRRPRVVALVIAAAALVPSFASAQEMTFDSGETSLTVHVVLTETSGVNSRAARSVIADIEDRITAIEGFEVIDARGVKRSLGRAYRDFKRCGGDVDCLLEFAELVPVDRMIFVRVLLEEGIYTVDLEMRAPGNPELRPYVPAPTEDLRDPSYLDDAVAELLLPPAAEETLPPDNSFVEPAPLDPIPDPDNSDSLLERDYAWYSAGAGAVLIATGGVFALLADTTLAEIQAGTHDRTKVDALIESGESNQLTANILFGTGLVALTGAVVLYFLTDDPVEAAGARLRLDPRQGGAAVVLEW